MRQHRASYKTLVHSSELRKNLTDAERKLWQALRSCQLGGVRFRRQHAVGPYILDFCAVKEGLVVELDGGQHLEQEGYDAERTAYLQAQGYRVLRFWNHEVMRDLDAVLLVIGQALGKGED